MPGTYRNLLIWQEAFALSVEVYRVTQAFPKEEQYGLTSQIRRSATSVVANIAEGQGRGTTRDFVNFLFIARGSARETACFCELAHGLGYLDSDSTLRLESRYQGLSAGIFRCIQGLSKKAKFDYHSLSEMPFD